MTHEPRTDAPITTWLHEWRRGDEQAFDKLFTSLYDELRSMAQRAMRVENTGHTLQPTALVHEAYGRLADAGLTVDDRGHFLAVAAQVMRRVLIDHARGKNRSKRGAGAEHVPLDSIATVAEPQPLPLLDLDEAMQRLGQSDPRKERIVELHYFGGLTHPEIAAALDVSPSTVDRDLRMARAWLRVQLAEASA